jgi:hypothetical protein
MLRKFLPAILFASILSGCGSDGTANGPTYTAAGPSGPVDPDVPEEVLPSGTHVVGRALGEIPLANAPIRFFTLSGTPIATTEPVVTDGGGFYFAVLPNSETSFRVTVQKDGETYAAEYRGYSANQEAIVTPLTNLWFARMQTHPAENPEQAATALRSLLHLPASFDLRADMGTVGHRPGFVARAYLRKARSAGQNLSTDGLSTYATDLVQAPPLTTDEGGIINGIFGDTAANAWAPTGTSLSNSVIAYISYTGDLKIGNYGGLIGWAMGLVLGQLTGNERASALEALGKELAKLSEEIDAIYQELSREISLSTYTLAFNLAKNRVAGPILASNQKLHDVLANGTSYAQVQALAAELTRTELTQTLATINNDQLTNPVDQGLIQRLINLSGLSSLSHYSNQVVFNPLTSEFNYFANLQTQATALVIEGYHAIQPPDPNAARNFFDQYCDNLASQASLLPQPLPDDEAIYLTGEGLLFHRRVVANSYKKVEAAAANMTSGPFHNYRIATGRELQRLRAAGGGNKAGLERIGFDFSALNGRDPEPYKILDEKGDTFNPDSSSEGENHLKRWKGGAPYGALLVSDLSKDLDENGQEGLISLGRVQALTVSDVSPASTNSTGQFRATGNYTIRIDGGTRTVSNVDLTSLVRWSSDNPSLMRLQNVPSGNPRVPLPNTPTDLLLGPGVYTWYNNGSVNVTASLRDPFTQNFTLISNTKQFTKSNYVPAQLRAILLTPKNLTLSSLPSPTRLSVLGLMSDGRSVNLSPANVTFGQIPGVQIQSANNIFQLSLTASPPGNAFVLNVTSTGNPGIGDTAAYFLNLP